MDGRLDISGQRSEKFEEIGQHEELDTGYRSHVLLRYVPISG